jgi:hypothetical protein
MPKQKDLKRLVRERMQKTGEAYTSARARLLEKKPAARKPAASPRASPPGPDLAALAGMSDASVAKKTGRTWKEWVAVLDRAGAAAKTHAEIAALLSTEHGVPDWWSQMVTVGYERIRGLRERGQRLDGSYDVNKSKVYPVPLAELWTAFVRCERWLGGAKLRMSKATKHKSMRMRWTDDTPVEVQFTPKSPERTQLTLQHRNLATREDAQRQRRFWTERLAALASVLAKE